MWFNIDDFDPGAIGEKEIDEGAADMAGDIGGVPSKSFFFEEALWPGTWPPESPGPGVMLFFAVMRLNLIYPL